MKNSITSTFWLFVCFGLTSCFITEVDQPDQVMIGEEFDIVVTVVDSLSDPNPWRGTLSVMVPEDWEFVSGVYDGDLGAGTMEVRSEWSDLVANADVSKTDSIRTPDPGTRWLDLISETPLGYEGPISNTVTVRLKAGTNLGSYDLGYIASKDAFPSARDVLGFWRDGSADSLFGQTIEIEHIPTTSTDVEKPQESRIEVYPNPSSGLVIVVQNEGNSALSGFELFDVNGRSVKSISSEALYRPGPGRIELDLNVLLPGSYFLKWLDGGVLKSQMLFIQ